jgi:hypothetical protein
MVLVLACLSSLNAGAQKTTIEKKSSLEIMLGGNAMGPAPQMFDLMKQYHFDATTDDEFFGGGATSHPFYGSSLAFSGQISYAYKIGAKSKAGLILGYSNLREVLGASDEGGNLSYLFVSFSSTYLIPVYRYELFKFLELQAGPALMFNNGKTTSMPTNNESYTRVAAGLLTGLNLNIWDTRVTYGKISGNYLFATQSKMGPFTAEGVFGTQTAIPESNLGFGHLIVGFIIGFHI